MSKVVFILGAGASRGDGAPLMGDFLDVANKLLWSGEVEDYREEFERVFRAIGSLQVVHSKSQLDLVNLESIFTVLELGRVIGRVGDLEADDIEAAISALKTVIVETLHHSMRFPVYDGKIKPGNVYNEFAKTYRKINLIAPKAEATIITFNYDIGLDMALYSNHVVPQYMLTGSRDLQPGQTRLLKLHGSLNWAVTEKPNRIVPIDLAEYLKGMSRIDWFDDEYTTATLPVGRNLAACVSRQGTDGETLELPFIVPPSWNKSDYHKLISPVWQEAASALSEAEHIFVMGYSLPATDAFFRHLYALGSVGTQPLRHFAVIDPDPSGAVRDRFLEILGPGATSRFVQIQKTFEHGVEYVNHYLEKTFDLPRTSLWNL